MRPAIILAALALAGCQTTRTITTTCVTEAQVQQLRDAMPPSVRQRLTGKADEDLRIIAASAARLRVYASGLLELLDSCSR